MKKLGLVILVAGFLAQVAFAFPPIFCNGCEPHLSNKGVMSKNTLKHTKCKDDDVIGYLGCFSGEVELTGVVVSAYNNEEEANFFETRFYPDSNLDLPFLQYSFCDASGAEFYGGVFDNRAQRWDCSKAKIPFERLHFGVYLKIDSKKVFLPKAIADKHLGESGIRAKVRLKDYRFYGEGVAGYEAYATLIEFSPLSEIYEHNKDGGSFLSLKYGSKDSFVNLRDKPNGNIIAQIRRDDMRCGDERAKIFGVGYVELEDSGDKKPQTIAFFDNGDYIFSNYSSSQELPQNKWLEVFYLAPNAKKPQEAIFGYIHSSQLKVSCK